MTNQKLIFPLQGDCYVAACGLPQSNPDHAVVMARFATSCRQTVNNLVRELEVELGPGTGMLGMRFGLHSGSCTAGVLRGQRARFQLFGDSVNTASRIETTGMKGRIHISQDTANILRAQGKGNWVIPRRDQVMAKGLGCISTAWLEIKPSGSSALESSISSTARTDTTSKELDATKRDRLVDWHTELFTKLLKEIIASRSQSHALVTREEATIVELEISSLATNMTPMAETKQNTWTPRAPENNTKTLVVEPTEVLLSSAVTDQLRRFIEAISSRYVVGYKDTTKVGHRLTCC